MDKALKDFINNEIKERSACKLCKKKFKQEEESIDIMCGKHIDIVCLECGKWFEKIQKYMRSSAKYLTPNASKQFKVFLETIKE